MIAVAGITELAPYLFGGGGAATILGALAWGINQGKVQVDSAEGNVRMAAEVRDQAMENMKASQEQVATLKVEVVDLKAANATLEAKIKALENRIEGTS